MIQFLVRTSCAAGVIVVVPLTVLAQQGSPQDSSRARGADSAKARTLPPVVVTGTWVPGRPSDLIFPTSVLDGAGLRREPLMFAATGLTRLPSVAIEEGAGVAGPTILRLRGGEESFTQVMFDGIPLNLTGGFMDLQGLTLTNVEQVEVARGPQSAMYGSSAMAGAVQMVTRQGQPGRPQVTLVGEGGGSVEHGGQSHGELAVSGGSREVQYSFAGAGTYFRGVYELPHDLRTWDASSRIDADLGGSWHLTGTARYMDIASQLPVRDPGVTRAPLDPNQRDGRTRMLASAGLRYAPTVHWSHALTLKAFRDDFVYEDQADGLDPADYPFFVFDFNFGLTSVQWRKTAEYVGSWTPGANHSGSLTVSFGGKFEREDLSSDQTGDFGDSQSAYDRNNGAGFIEVQSGLGSWVDVLAGARYEQFQGLSGTFLPRAGLSVAVVPGHLKLRASAGRAFKAPNLEQQYLDNPFTAPNPALAPETSIGWETGVVAMAPGTGMTATGTFFHQTYDDLIRLVPIDTTGRGQNQNLGKSRVLGVEVEMDKWWGTRWHASVGATWLETTMLENTGLSDELYPVGSKLLGVPGWTGNAVLEGDLTRVFSASVRGRLVGKQEVFTERFFGERVTLDPYVLLGLTLRARVSGRAEAYLRGENLLDTGYLTGYDRPGLPLTLVGGMRLMAL
jgi:vitamin B12 transporter